MHQTYLRIMLGLIVNVMDSNACTLISEHFDGGWAYVEHFLMLQSRELCKKTE